jgi:hypothetical protein
MSEPMEIILRTRVWTRASHRVEASANYRWRRLAGPLIDSRLMRHVETPVMERLWDAVRDV